MNCLLEKLETKEGERTIRVSSVEESPQGDVLSPLVWKPDHRKATQPIDQEGPEPFSLC